MVVYERLQLGLALQEIGFRRAERKKCHDRTGDQKSDGQACEAAASVRCHTLVIADRELLRQFDALHVHVRSIQFRALRGGAIKLNPLAGIVP